MKIIVFLFIVSILFSLKLFKIKILTPIELYSYMWIFFILGGIVFLSDTYQFYYTGIIWILISILISIFTVCLLNYILLYKKVYNKFYFAPNIPWNILLMIICFSFLSVVYQMIKNGISLNVFFDFTSLQSISHNMAVSRYTEEQNITFFGQIINSYIYIAPLCSGYSLPLAKEKKQKFICYISFFPSLLLLLITSAKLAIISSIILFSIGYYVSYLYIYAKYPKINKSDIFKFLIIFVILFCIFYLSFILRIGSTKESVTKTIINKLLIYTFGHIQAFDFWFNNFGLYLNSLAFGSNTFLAITSKIGLATKQLGIYEILEGSSSNVYTYFRGYIEDYGIIFSILFICFIIAIMEYCVFKLIYKGKYKLIYQFILSFSLFTIVYYIVSAWAYTTYFFTFFIYLLYLLLCFGPKIRIKIG